MLLRQYWKVRVNFRKENLPFAFFIWMTSDLVYHNTFNIQKRIMMVSLRRFFIPHWCFTEGWMDT